MFEQARKLGDKLVVILNNDNWLRDKKGFAFMPQHERKEMIEAFPFVDKVVFTSHDPHDDDRSVVRELRTIRPAIFANGGDRVAGNIPEYQACEKLGIEMVFNIGEGGKIQSSSWMISAASRDVRRSVRPWGEFYNWDTGAQWHLKTLYVRPGKRLSLQYHKHRAEKWLLLEGDATATVGPKGGTMRRIGLKRHEVFTVPKGYVHRLESKKGGVLAEIAAGKFDEADIIRLEDDYDRHLVAMGSGRKGR
jgi:mannose-6-phosphate isomerase-like protein (cupin superfamily)/glycerol-3-phosphate cytidylyltransferase-like family protein